MKSTGASLVKFAYYDGAKEEIVEFCVSSEYLWSAEGLAQLYEACRDSYLGADVDMRASWHLAGVANFDGFVIEADEVIDSKP